MARLARPQGKPKGPIRCVSPTLRDVFSRADADGLSAVAIAARMDVHQGQVGNWRRGVSEPGIMAVEALAAAAGYRLVLEPIRKED